MSENRSDKMANWPMGKLIYSMSIPAVFSMLIQALYNIVDTIYVSRLGEDALFSIGLVFPLQMIIISLALAAGIGASTVVARRLGERRPEEASRTACTGFALSLIHYLITAFVGVFLSVPFLKLFVSDPVIITMGFDYLKVVMGLSIGVFVSLYFARILQATGNMITPMTSQLIGAIINIVLDPIMIFGYFGFPAMGMTGAALATVIGQIASMIYASVVMFFGKNEVHFHLRYFSMDLERIREIYQVGIPVAILNAVGSITTTLMNAVLVQYGSVGVTTLSIYFKLQSFVFMPVFGFNQGCLPIFSYNYGAKNHERFMSATKVYLLNSILIMGIGTLLFMTIPNLLMMMFNPQPELLSVGNIALRIISISFIPASVTIAMVTIFQSLGHGVESMYVSLLRQLIFLVPLAFVFGKIWGLNGIWFAYPSAEVLVCIIFIPLCLSTIHKAFH